MEKQIKLFLEFLENDKKLSSNTLQSYKRDITQYQEYIDKNGLNYLKIDNEDIDKYFDTLKSLNKKTSTISRNLATIRSYYQFLLRNSSITKPKNPFPSTINRQNIATHSITSKPIFVPKTISKQPHQHTNAKAKHLLSTNSDSHTI